MLQQKYVNKGVLIIYTGGTIGCAPGDPMNPDSPLTVVPWKDFNEKVPLIAETNKKFPVACHEMTPPLDSTNMVPENWIQIAKIIKEEYDKYEGFVILHGTDTMVYTASALSFMLGNLNKPVIITGSQLPVIDRSRTDGIQNLIAALEVANPAYYRLPLVPEVCILFGGVLLRGNRARKISASGYNGFDSPNYPPLGTIGEHININPELLLKRDTSPLRVNTHLQTNVSAALIFPGIQESSLLYNIVTTPELKGLVLLAYGTGNVPTAPKFLGAIDKAHEKGQVVLDVTQCHQGAVELGTYDTSAVLLERGVVSGSDITPEAALCKLMVLLGDEEDLTKEGVLATVQKDMAGEQSRSVVSYITSTEPATLDITNRRWRGARIAPSKEWSNLRKEKILLRLYGAEMSVGDDSVPINLSCYLGLRSTDTLDRASTEFVNDFLRYKKHFNSMIILDITEKFLELASPNELPAITLYLNNEEPGYCLKWKKAELAVLTNSGAQ